MEPRPNGNAAGLPRRGGRGRPSIDEPIEVRRYIDALKRSRWLIAGLVLSAAVTAFALSSWTPNKYTATTTIVKRVSTTPFESTDADSLTRELNTIVQLLVTSDVLDKAAKRVGGGATATSLSKTVKSKVEPEANLISVTVTDRDPKRAATIANAVGSTFVDEQAAVSRQQYEQARAGLLEQLTKISKSDPGAAQEEQAIRQRLSDVGVSLASAGQDLRIAQSASVPTSPTSPKPVRNSVIAIFLGLFIGILVALGRDQLVPRPTGPRELTRLLDLPMLASVPHVRRRWGRRPGVLTGVEYESYQTLGTSLRFALPPEMGPHLLLITSGLHAEGKSTVTARLGRALAQAGHPTLLISADLRWPTLHTIMKVDESPGLTELLLDYADGLADGEFERLVTSAIVPLENSQRRGDLDVLPSGAKHDDPAQLLASDGLAPIIDAVRAMNYSYILIDAPPLLGIADTQTLARQVSNVLFVARLDRVTLDTVVDAHDVLDRLEVDTIGCVVIGARSEASPYYTGLRTAALEDA